MPPRSGEELKEELESRQDSRIVRALEMVAPGSALREGIDNIQHARTGGLIVIGDADELAFLFSGGIKLDIDYSPEYLYELAKMDGAIILSANSTKIANVNVQLTPDPTILTHETGTRHRTAERVSKQTDALVIAVSERREVVSLYVDGIKYILEDIPVVLAKANQALATLDKYRSRLDQVSTRLTALEFEGGATLHDVLTVLQRAELVTRMAVEIERFIVELGTEGRLIEMQLDETMVGVAADKTALIHDYLTEDSDHVFTVAFDQLVRLPHQDLLDLGRWSSASWTSLGDWRSCSPPQTANWRPSTVSARSERRTSVRVFAGSRRSIWSTATYRRRGTNGLWALPARPDRGGRHHRANGRALGRPRGRAASPHRIRGR